MDNAFFCFHELYHFISCNLIVIEPTFLFADKAKIDILRLNFFYSYSLSLYLNPINLHEIKASDLHDFRSWY